MSAIIIKDADEIVLMRQAGKLLSQVFKMLEPVVKPGVSTLEINDRVEDYIVNDLQARPASKGQYGYKFALNSSINEVVCHGIPDRNRKLKTSDIINVDITLEKDGFIADSSTTFVMPGASRKSQKLVKTTYKAMWAGIREVRPGARLGDVGAAIQQLAEKAGYSVVRDYCGHYQVTEDFTAMIRLNSPALLLPANMPDRCIKTDQRQNACICSRCFNIIQDISPDRKERQTLRQRIVAHLHGPLWQVRGQPWIHGRKHMLAMEVAQIKWLPGNVLKGPLSPQAVARLKDFWCQATALEFNRSRQP